MIIIIYYIIIIIKNYWVILPNFNMFCAASYVHLKLGWTRKELCVI